MTKQLEECFTKGGRVDTQELVLALVTYSGCTVLHMLYMYLEYVGSLKFGYR